MLRAQLLPMTDTPVAWTEVAARLEPYLSRRVPAADVDDVLQEVLLRMHRGFGSLRDEDRFTGWMFRIASNAIAEHGRTRARHPIGEPAEATGVPADHDDRIAADLLAACLTIFVARLAPPYRDAVTLVELEGKTAREAAELVGISVSGMKSRVQRGRAQLRSMIEACCEIALDSRGRVTDVTSRAPTCTCSTEPPR